MLIDHRGPFAIVPHPRHQVPEPDAAPGREVVARVPEVVKWSPGSPIDAAACG
jgi:hypothetical protein